MSAPQAGAVADVVSLFVFVAAALFSQDVADVVGPYIAVMVAAAIGASFSLARRDRTSRTGAVLFFVRVCGLATLLTVGLSALIAALHPSLSERALLAPVAFGIGLVGNDWPDIARWCADKASALVDVFIKRKGDGS